MGSGLKLSQKKRSVEIYCGFRFRSPLYSTAVLNLNRSLVLLFKSFYPYFSSRETNIRISFYPG